MRQNQGVIASILEIHDELPDSERRIADFILGKHDAVSFCTASEIAQSSKTSNATMSRFVRRLGYPSFAAMRLAMAREETKRVTPIDAARGITSTDIKGSARFILDKKVQELEATYAGLDFDALRRALDLLRRADTVMVVGAGSSLSYAQVVAVKFSQIGLKAIALATTDASTMMAMRLSNQDCIVVVSSSGTSRRLSHLMDSAEEAAVPTISITAKAGSELAQRADASLVVSSYDHLLASNFDFSYTSINYVVELLILFLLHEGEDADEYLKMFVRAMRFEKGPAESAGSGAGDAGGRAGGASVGLDRAE